jgi:hypothetical protein
MSKVKRMPIKEFRESGLLFHINHTVLHPLGLALEVTVADDGSETLSGVWDCRDDPEGIRFGPELLEAGVKKYHTYMQEQGLSYMETRDKLLGYVVQPLEDEEDENT